MGFFDFDYWRRREEENNLLAGRSSCADHNYFSNRARALSIPEDDERDWIRTGTVMIIDKEAKTVKYISSKPDSYREIGRHLRAKIREIELANLIDFDNDEVYLLNNVQLWEYNLMQKELDIPLTEWIE